MKLIRENIDLSHVRIDRACEVNNFMREVNISRINLIKSQYLYSKNYHMASTKFVLYVKINGRE